MKNFIFILFIILVSCISKNDVITIPLNGKQIITEAKYMRVPFRINLVNDKLILFDLVPDSSFCHIYNYPNYEYINSVGVKGNGPNEITLITPCQISDSNLLLFDGARGKLFNYKLADLSFKTYEFNVPKSIDFIQMNDTTLIIEDMSGENRFIKTTPSTSKGIFNLYENKNLNNSNKGYYWRSYLSYNTELNMIITATQFGEVIEIYNLNNGNIIRHVGDDGLPNPIAARSRYGYYDVKWIDNKVYALYSRKTSNNSKLIGGDELQVMNINGEILYKYKLDKQLYSFDIDKKRNIILGLCPNEDYPIYIYTIPEKF